MSGQFLNDGFLWVKTTEYIRIFNILNLYFFSQIKFLYSPTISDLSKTWKHIFRIRYVGQTPVYSKLSNFKFICVYFPSLKPCRNVLQTSEISSVIAHQMGSPLDIPFTQNWRYFHFFQGYIKCFKLIIIHLIF